MDIWYYVLTPFTWLLTLFYNVFGNYGAALIVFALIVKLILFPFSLKGKRGMIQMNMLNGKIRPSRRSMPTTGSGRIWRCRSSTNGKTSTL